MPKSQLSPALGRIVERVQMNALSVSGHIREANIQKRLITWQPPIIKTWLAAKQKQSIEIETYTACMYMYEMST
jgi:hypothetical protein